MEKNGKKITVADVARLSGISKGTVDRVIHNRGEVSEESRRKVLEVIEQIGYRPNRYASMLASRKSYRIACLIPESRSGEYWELVHEGIERAAVHTSDYPVTIFSVTYDQFDISTFRQAREKMLDEKPDAVLLAPIFGTDTLWLTTELSHRQIPYVYIDSRPDDDRYLAYYGIAMYASGYLAASLLTDGMPVHEIANFRIDRGHTSQSDPTLRRREGFLNYITEHLPDCRIYNTFIRPHDEAYNIRELDRFFEEHPAVRHIITFNSRVHLIARYLEYRNRNDCRTVGFDMLNRNIDYLKKGFVTLLIAQRTETQIYRGIQALIDYLTLKKHPEKQDNYMSMDILTRYNVEYYSDR